MSSIEQRLEYLEEANDVLRAEPRPVHRIQSLNPRSSRRHRRNRGRVDSACI